MSMDPRAGQEPTNVLRVVFGIGLGVLMLMLFGYAFIRCYQRGQCCRGPDFAFNLCPTRGLGSVAVELVPPFSISGSLSRAGSGYLPFHSQGP